ncbi:hypothetical protein ACEQPO_12595 [Bacillus sp. SL00103]
MNSYRTVLPGHEYLLPAQQKIKSVCSNEG